MTEYSKYNKWLMSCDYMAGLFSTCSKKQYAAFIISTSGRVVGFGYNGSPPGHAHCSEGACPRFEQKTAHGASYDNCIANHAEANALLYSNFDSRQGGTLIVNGPPCYGCSKLIASSGVGRVVHYTDEMYAQWPDCERLLMFSNIEIVSVDRE